MHGPNLRDTGPLSPRRPGGSNLTERSMDAIREQAMADITIEEFTAEAEAFLS